MNEAIFFPTLALSLYFETRGSGSKYFRHCTTEFWKGYATMMAKTHYGNCDAPVNHSSADIQTPILSLKAWSRDTFSGIYLTKYRHLCVSKIAYVLLIMEKNT